MTDSTAMDRAKSSSVGGIASQAEGLKEEVQQHAAALTDTVSQTAKEQVTKIKSVAEDVAKSATSKVKEAFGEQKSAGADYIREIAQSIHRAAGELEESVPPAAKYIRDAASHLEGAAEAIRDKDVREWVDEARQFARAQPTLVFGGAMVLGFAALRLFKNTSAPEDHSAARS